jgi:DNA-binding GntR family transcriptional regulator
MLLGEWVYRRIREEIASGRLVAGSPVREAELTRLLGVSRTPICEALRRLVAESLLERVRDGLVVPIVDLDSLLEAYDLREEMEGTAARMAASHRIEADVRRLEHVLEQEVIADVEDPFERARLNQEFHQALYRAAHNRYLLKMLTGLFDVFYQIQLSTLVLPDRVQVLAQHRQITEAVAAGNPQAAEAAAREHIHLSRGALVKAFIERSSRGR